MTTHPDINPPRFWERLTPDGRDAIRSAAVERRHRRGATLFREGDTTDSVIATQTAAPINTAGTT